MYTGGIPVNVHTAALKIAKTEECVAVDKDDTAARFEVKLPTGRTKLEAWFIGEPGAIVFSPYYVYIQKAD
jgi:hypothetical protein